MFHKKKWAYQAKQRTERVKRAKVAEESNDTFGFANRGRNPGTATLGGFLRQAHQTLLNSPWQIIQVKHFLYLHKIQHC
jgi:hypothetical protein